MPEKSDICNDVMNVCEDGVVILNSEGEVLDANETFRKMFECGKKKLKENSFFDLISILDGDPATVWSKIMYQIKHVEEMEPCVFDTSGDGEQKRLRFTVFRAGTENSERFVCFWRDITLQMFTEQIISDIETGFQTIQQHIPVGMFRSKEDGNLISVNPALLRMLGYGSQIDLYKASLEETWADASKRKELISRLKQEGSVADFEAQLRKNNGNLIWVSINAVAKTDDDGQFMYFDAIVLDILLRKIAEEEVESYRNHLKELVENRTAELSSVNDQLLLEIAERHKAEAVKSVLYQILKESSTTPDLKELLIAVQYELTKLLNADNFYVSIYHSADQTYSFPYGVDEQTEMFQAGNRVNLDGSLTDYVRKTSKPLLATGETCRQLEIEGKARQIGPPSLVWLGAPLKASGKVFGVMAVHSYTISNAYSESDIELFSAISDCVAMVIEKLEAGKRLRENEVLYRTITESLRECLLIVDVEENVVYANPAFCRTMGYRREEAEKINIIDIVEKESLEVIQKETEKRRQGISSQYEIRMKKKNGKFMLMLISVSPRFDSDGEYLGAVGLLRDITEERKAEAEKKRIEAQIQHTQKLESLGILAGGIAHDFNNLLVGILGNADMAMHEIRSDSAAHYCISEILKGSQKAAELSRQMLAYTGQGSFSHDLINLSETIEEIKERLQVSTSGRAAIQFRLADNLPVIEADPSHVFQVLVNLITNASEAMIGDIAGIISIATGVMECDSEYFSSTYLSSNSGPGRYVFLEVSDNGCGIENKTVDRIFDPFYTTKYVGRGLGLAAVLGIIRSHNGAIKVYSKLGEGTSVKVLFPVCHRIPIRKEPEKHDDTPFMAEGVVLLVDDESTVLSVAKRMLEKAGFTVITAVNGAEAVEVFRKKKEICCVIMDMSMPEMNGLEACEQIHKIQDDVPVVLSSGYTEGAVLKQFESSGISGFVQKPYNMSVLLDAVKLALQNKQLP